MEGGREGQRRGRGRGSDLLWALACLTDELQAAGAPCGDWPRPICPLPLRRTELMCENPGLGTPSIFHLHLRLSLYLTLLPRFFFFFFISEPLYLSLRSYRWAGATSTPTSPPLLTSSLVPPPLLLPGAAVIFPHLRLIPGSGECMTLFVWCQHFIGFLLLWNRGSAFQIHQGPI